MMCEPCHGRGELIRSVPYITSLGLCSNWLEICLDCGGTGIAHCCDGMREQPVPDEEPEPPQPESGGLT